MRHWRMITRIGQSGNKLVIGVIIGVLFLLGQVVAHCDYVFDSSYKVFDRGEKARIVADRYSRFYCVAQDIAATTSTIRYAYSVDLSVTDWNALRNVISAADVYELPDVAVDDVGMVHVGFAHTNSSNYLIPQYRSARSFDESFSASVAVFGTGTVVLSPKQPVVLCEFSGGRTRVFYYSPFDAGASPWRYGDLHEALGSVYSYSTVFAAEGAISTQHSAEVLGASIGNFSAAVKGIFGDASLANYAVWIYSTDVYYDESANGSTWGTDTLISASAALAEDIDIAAGDDNWDTDGNDDLIVVWSDRRNGYSQIYADWSRDAGTTWQTDIQVLGTATRYYDQDSPAVAIGQEDGKVHLTWRDMRFGTSSIFYIQGIYAAAGMQWGVDADEDGIMDSGELNNYLQVDDDTHDAVQKDPDIAVDRYNNVIVAWQDTFTGNIRSAALLYNID